MIVERLTQQAALFLLPQFVSLLQDAVDDGASIGFLPPLTAETAQQYWHQVIKDLEAGSRVLLAALEGEQMVGCVQLELAMRQNGLHRAEVQKLMVHTSCRRRGIGRALLAAVEQEARALGRRLLVLDTRRGDAAERLYRSHGYTAAGIIPQFALSANGQLDDTVFFYRLLTGAQ